MEKEFAEKMKQSLLNLKSEIIGQLMTNNNDFRQIVESMEAKDVVDIASDDIDRKMLDAAGARDVNRLKLIDSALTPFPMRFCAWTVKARTKSATAERLTYTRAGSGYVRLSAAYLWLCRNFLAVPRTAA